MRRLLDNWLDYIHYKTVTQNSWAQKEWVSIMERPEKQQADSLKSKLPVRPERPIAAAIYDRVVMELAPTELDIIDESRLHHHHEAMKAQAADGGKSHPKGRETHFRIIIVSDRFRGLTILARHQLVYKILRPEIALGIHAISLELRLPV